MRGLEETCALADPTELGYDVRGVVPVGVALQVGLHLSPICPLNDERIR